MRDGLVSKEELEEILEQQHDARQLRVSGRRLGEILIQRGLVTPAQVAKLVAEQYELPFLDFDVADVDLRVATLLTEDQARRFSALPISRHTDGTYLLAIADPGTVLFSEELRGILGSVPRFAVVGPDAIERVIDYVHSQPVVLEPAASELESEDDHAVVLEFPSAGSFAALFDQPELQIPRHDSVPLLGALLVRDGFVTENELEAALAQQRLSPSLRLGEILVEKGLVTPAVVARLLAEQYEMRYFDLGALDLDRNVASRLPDAVARNLVAVPIAEHEDGSLDVAISDPTRAAFSDELHDALGVPLTIVMASPDAILAVLDDLQAPSFSPGEPVGDRGDGVLYVAEEVTVAEEEDVQDAASFVHGEAGETEDEVVQAQAPTEPAAWRIVHEPPAEAEVTVEQSAGAEFEAAFDEPSVTEGELSVAEDEAPLAEVEPALEEPPVAEAAEPALEEPPVAEAAESASEPAVAEAESGVSTFEFVVEEFDTADVAEADVVQKETFDLAFREPPSDAPTEPAYEPMPWGLSAGHELEPEKETEPLNLADETDAHVTFGEPPLDEEPSWASRLELVDEVAPVDEPDEPTYEAYEFEHEEFPAEHEEPSAEREEPESVLVGGFELPFMTALEHEPVVPEGALEAEGDMQQDDDEQDLHAEDDQDLHEESAEPHVLEALELSADETALEATVAPEPEWSFETTRDEGAPDETPETVDGDERFPETVEAALAAGAATVHFSPLGSTFAARARIDGVVRDLGTVTREERDTVVSHLEAVQAVRTYVSETPRGEKTTLFVREPAGAPRSLEDLGPGSPVADALRAALERPSGAVLVCGPTGSGTTTTLYAALEELVRPDRVVTTFESPVERLLDGVDQVEIDPALGTTFASALRDLRFTDPDVVLVGDLPDREAAELAVHAAADGRLVMASFHATGTAAAIRRLLELGLDSTVLGASLGCVVAQRLVRTVCANCRETYYASDAELELLGESEDGSPRLLARGTGCSSCDGSGFRGRTGVFEVMPVTDDVRELVSEGASAKKIQRAAVAAGMKTLRAEGVRLCLDGVTTVAEVERVLGLDG